VPAVLFIDNFGTRKKSEVIMIEVLVALGGLVVGGLLGWFGRQWFAQYKRSEAFRKIDDLIRQAKREAEKKKNEILLKAREERHRLRENLEREYRERQEHLEELEAQLQQKEKELEDWNSNLAVKEAQLEAAQKELEEEKARLAEREEELARIIQYCQAFRRRGQAFAAGKYRERHPP
jgi:ribonuclease Y